VPAVAPATVPTALADDPIGMDDPPAPAGLLTHGVGTPGVATSAVRRQSTGCCEPGGKAAMVAGAPFWGL